MNGATQSQSPVTPDASIASDGAKSPGLSLYSPLRSEVGGSRKPSPKTERSPELIMYSPLKSPWSRWRIDQAQAEVRQLKQEVEEMLGDEIRKKEEMLRQQVEFNAALMAKVREHVQLYEQAEREEVRKRMPSTPKTFAMANRVGQMSAKIRNRRRERQAMANSMEEVSPISLAARGGLHHPDDSDDEPLVRVRSISPLSEAPMVCVQDTLVADTVVIGAAESSG
eukprot:TRINITY_DN59770_c0_g1_i1.p1 TRINITY_DN59770_c0_g1~~TRINITY_DN59770_c0_g1_i1.p1  ORF type:complete len:225 (+),score=34.91 TRINITY_DN59770_c0_g1_i1:272-946(+)